MYKNKEINKNIKRILVIFTTLLILLISFGLLFNRSNNKNNNVGLSPQTQKIQLNSDDGSEKIIQTSTGYEHSIALSSTGQVYTWGFNANGQIGNGNNINQSIPQNITTNFVGLEGQIISVALGHYHSTAISSTGQVYTWGRNDFGQLGDGTNDDKNKPQNITSNFSGTGTITQISSGFQNSSAVSSTGQVYTWGDNRNAQIGDGGLNANNTPQNITTNFSGLDENDKIIQTSMGYAHSSALSNDGKLYMWGNSLWGKLGFGNTINHYTPFLLTISSLVQNEKIIQVSLGQQHSMVLTNLGKVFTYGYNHRGQLGIGSMGGSKTTPENITSNFGVIPYSGKIAYISTGANHSAALSDSGQVYTWGWNETGQLGNRSNDDKHTPQNIINEFKELDDNEKIIQISSGSGHMIASTDFGKVFIWGKNNYGQLGIGTGDWTTAPHLTMFSLSQWNITLTEQSFDNISFTTPSTLPSDDTNLAQASIVRGDETISIKKSVVIDSTNIFTPIANKSFIKGDKIKLEFTITKDPNVNPMIINTIQYVDVPNLKILASVTSSNIDAFDIDSSRLATATITFPAGVASIEAELESKNNLDTSNNWISVTGSKKDLPKTNGAYTHSTPLLKGKTYRLKIVVKTVEANYVSSTTPAYSQNSIKIKGVIDPDSLNRTTLSINKNKVISNITLPVGVKKANVSLMQSNTKDGNYTNVNDSLKVINSSGNVEWDVSSISKAINNKYIKVEIIIGTADIDTNNFVALSSNIIHNSIGLKYIEPSSTNIGAIIGGVIGGLAALGLIGGLTFILIKKKNDPNFRMPSFKKK